MLVFEIVGALVVIAALRLAYSYRSGSRKQPEGGELHTHEEACAAALTHLHANHGLTIDDVKQLYEVTVKKFKTAQPTNGARVRFEVAMSSKLYICLPGESLIGHLTLQLSERGQVVGSNSDVIGPDSAQPSTMMRLTPERLRIREDVDRILASSGGEGIEQYLTPGSGHPLIIYDSRDAYEIFKGRFDDPVFRLTYDKHTQVLREFDSPLRTTGPSWVSDPHADPEPESDERVLYSHARPESAGGSSRSGDA